MLTFGIPGTFFSSQRAFACGPSNFAFELSKSLWHGGAKEPSRRSAAAGLADGQFSVYYLRGSSEQLGDVGGDALADWHKKGSSEPPANSTV